MTILHRLWSIITGFFVLRKRTNPCRLERFAYSLLR